MENKKSEVISLRRYAELFWLDGALFADNALTSNEDDPYIATMANDAVKHFQFSAWLDELDKRRSMDFVPQRNTKINFRIWLEEQGVDTTLFWKNCKRKHNGFITFTNRRRSELKYIVPCRWLVYAFNWEKSLQTGVNWCVLDIRWYKICAGNEVEFGF